MRAQHRRLVFASQCFHSMSSLLAERALVPGESECEPLFVSVAGLLSPEPQVQVQLCLPERPSTPVAQQCLRWPFADRGSVKCPEPAYPGFSFQYMRSTQWRAPLQPL